MQGTQQAKSPPFRRLNDPKIIHELSEESSGELSEDNSVETTERKRPIISGFQRDYPYINLSIAKNLDFSKYFTKHKVFISFFKKQIMEINNIGAGKHFCRAVREIRNRPEPEWYNQTDIYATANLYNVSAVFAGDGKHWTLVTDILDGDQLRIYDPLGFYNSSQTILEKPLSDFIFLVATGEVHKSIEPEDYIWDKAIPVKAMDALLEPTKENLENLIATGYHLNMINIRRIQEDGHNCGPLSVYAALVGNRHTPEFEPHVRWIDILRDTGIVVH